MPRRFQARDLSPGDHFVDVRTGLSFRVVGPVEWKETILAEAIDGGRAILCGPNGLHEFTLARGYRLHIPATTGVELLSADDSPGAVIRPRT